MMGVVNIWVWQWVTVGVHVVMVLGDTSKKLESMHTLCKMWNLDHGASYYTCSINCPVNPLPNRLSGWVKGYQCTYD